MGRQVESEIADPGTAKSVDDHVVDRAGRDRREVRIGRQLTVEIREQLLEEHRQHDKPAIWQDARTARCVVEGGVGLAYSGEIDAQQRSRHRVDEPEFASFQQGASK